MDGRTDGAWLRRDEGLFSMAWQVIWVVKHPSGASVDINLTHIQVQLKGSGT